MKKTVGLCLVAALIITLFCACADTGESAVDSTADGSYYARLIKCREQIEAKTDLRPDVVIIMGSGVSKYAESLDVVCEIPYSDIEGWPTTDSPGSEGKLLFADRDGLKIAVLQGRPHYFEGYSGEEIVIPIRVLHMLGADTVIMVSMVGAINPGYHVGDFVSVKDHISSFIPSPLIGENIDELGERYTDMTSVYDRGMRQTVSEICKENDIPLHSGTFLQVTGPQYETPAEIEMYRKLGADTICMSDAAEAMAAVHMGMKVCSVNSISNMAAGMEEKISHDELLERSSEAQKNLTVLMNGLLDSLQ